MHVLPRTANAVALAERYHRILMGLPAPLTPEPEGPFVNEEERYWHHLLCSVRSLPRVAVAWGFGLAVGDYPEDGSIPEARGYGVSLQLPDEAPNIVEYGIVRWLWFEPLPTAAGVDLAKMEVYSNGVLIGIVYYDVSYFGRPLTLQTTINHNQYVLRDWAGVFGPDFNINV